MPAATIWGLGVVDGGLDLPLIPWEGGPAYYTVAQTGTQMTKAEAAGWSDPTWFPITLFLGQNSGTAAQDYLDLGINCYVACQHTPTNITSVTGTGMNVLAQYDEWTTGQIGSDPLCVGWFVWDEPDLNTTITTYKADVDTVRARADGRFVSTNWSSGVIPFAWNGGSQQGWMAQGVPYADVVSLDQYVYTSPGVRNDNMLNADSTWPGAFTDASVKTSSAYGWLIDRLGVYDDALDPNPHWITVETQMPYLTDTGRGIILYAQIEGAVFSAIAHEARGIMYFDFNGFYGAGAPATDPNTGLAPNQGDPSLLNGDAALKSAVQATNAKVASYATVLNTQSYVFDFGAASIDTMLKAKDGFAYIFASVGIDGATGSKTFTLTGSGISGTTVTVLDESRTINVTAGAFSDTFSNEYSHHVYRIPI